MFVCMKREGRESSRKNHAGKAGVRILGARCQPTTTVCTEYRRGQRRNHRQRPLEHNNDNDGDETATTVKQPITPTTTTATSQTWVKLVLLLKRGWKAL